MGFANAATIQRLLEDQRTQAQMRGGVLVVDEAGMVSARQMAELLAFAEKQSVRIVFSGDTRQIQSVEAGDALRILEKESHLKNVSLTEVQRQTARDYREAIEELRRNPPLGFEKLEAIGAIHEVAFDERAQRVAEAWREAESRLNVKGQPSHVLVVCATHEEIANVTHAIRAERRGAGELGEGARAERLVPQNYTAAQKKHCRNFRAIQRGPTLAREIARQTVIRDRELLVKPEVVPEELPEQEIRHEQIERGPRLERGHQYGIGR